MFPTLQVTVSGLDPLQKYSLMVDFKCIDKNRYRYSFHQSKWVIAGTGKILFLYLNFIKARDFYKNRFYKKLIIFF